MPQYLVSVHRQIGEDPFVAPDETMSHAIDALNHEMKAAGIRKFVGGLRPLATARSLRLQSDGSVTLTHGPILDSPAYLDGFWVLEVADLDAALAWGRKASTACRASVEVRPFH
jgi:hypothetical protein